MSDEEDQVMRFSPEAMRAVREIMIRTGLKTPIEAIALFLSRERNRGCRVFIHSPRGWYHTEVYGPKVG